MKRFAICLLVMMLISGCGKNNFINISNRNKDIALLKDSSGQDVILGARHYTLHI